MPDTIDDLAIEFAEILTSADESTADGCEFFCRRLQFLYTKVRIIHSDNCHKGADYDEAAMFRSKRLCEAILGVQQLAVPHAEKEAERKWIAQMEQEWDERAADQ